MNVLRRSLVYVLAALLTVPSPVFAAGIVADPAAAPETDLLRHEPGDCEAYAADGEGRGQQLHAHDELVEPYARRAYAPGQPGLEDHTYAAHEQRSPGQQRRIHD